MKKMFCLIFFCSLLLAFPGFSPAQETLMMATTTSTDNTGFLDYLAPKFEKDTGVHLKWTAVGTGKALELGKNCDVDVLLVHAPGAERQYVKEGYGVDRRKVMYNDFVIIGPPADPADIKGEPVIPALESIARQGNIFVSRGDDSGTNKKEIQLWEKTGSGVPSTASWYLETGQGMLSTIRIAAERNGYTLSDRGTYIKYAHNFDGHPPLDILVQGDKSLFNQYSVMAVNPDRCPEVKYKLSQKFIEWITDSKAQGAIKDYRLLGKELFTPNAE